MRTIENAKELENLIKEDKVIMLDFYADTCHSLSGIDANTRKISRRVSRQNKDFKRGCA